MPIGKPCGEPLCPKLAELGHRYCSKHEQLNPTHNFRRDNREKNPFYDSKEWRAARLSKIATNPVCEICNELPTRTVHHIKPLKQYPELALDESNLQSACTSCHNRESQRERTEAQKYKECFK